MNAHPLTLTARTPDAARRALRLYTVNALAVSVLQDNRAPLMPTDHKHPLARAIQEVYGVGHNPPPRSGGGVTTHDYLTAYRRWRDAVQWELDCERYNPDKLPAAMIAARKAEDEMRQEEAAMRQAIAPGVRVGSATLYRVPLPPITYVHPQYGPHLSSDARTLTVDTSGLIGDALAVFVEFRRDYQTRGDARWVLYAPDAANGMQAVGKADATKRALRGVFEQLTAPLESILTGMVHGIPEVIGNDVAFSVLKTV